MNFVFYRGEHRHLHEHGRERGGRVRHSRGPGPEGRAAAHRVRQRGAPEPEHHRRGSERGEAARREVARGAGAGGAERGRGGEIGVARDEARSGRDRRRGRHRGG